MNTGFSIEIRSKIKINLYFDASLVNKVTLSNIITDQKLFRKIFRSLSFSNSSYGKRFIFWDNETFLASWNVQIFVSSTRNRWIFVPQMFWPVFGFLHAKIEKLWEKSFSFLNENCRFNVPVWRLLMAPAVRTSDGQTDCHSTLNGFPALPLTLPLPCPPSSWSFFSLSSGFRFHLWTKCVSVATMADGAEVAPGVPRDWLVDAEAWTAYPPAVSLSALLPLLAENKCRFCNNIFATSALSGEPAKSSRIFENATESSNFLQRLQKNFQDSSTFVAKSSGFFKGTW